MKAKPVSILLLEDDEGHLELIRRAFAAYPGRFRLTVAGTMAEAQAHLAESQPDLVIADLILPDGRGTELLQIKNDGPSLPLLVMTAYGDEHVAVEAMKAGALDYIAKSDTTLADMPHIAEGALREWEHIAERKRAEAELRESEERYRRLVDTAPDVIYSLSAQDGTITSLNPAFEKVTGWPRDEWLGRPFAPIIHPDDQPLALRTFQQALRGESPPPYELRVLSKSGEYLVGEFTTAPLIEGGKVTGEFGMARDITERKRAEEELRRQEEALHRAARLESIGKLAGGVAHDFNNLMTGVLGYSDFLLHDLEEDDPRRQDVEEIKMAARRAADLTRQLLAFSRRETLEPEVLDLNAVVTNMSRMLERLVGEHIKLVTAFEPALGKVKADQTHMEQVIMNLVVNSRDAMPEGGKLTIETANVELDEGQAATLGDVAPGSYVMMAITDTGCGMDERTREHAFDPFFTTKAPGEGTGLGLATVYGIVRQHDGHIRLYSEPGQGTTFKMYLPRVEVEVEALAEETMAEIAPGGTETVLIVEDEQTVRRLAHRVLEAKGYTVLTVSAAAEARIVMAEHGEEIALLLTDVILPDDPGPTLCAELAGQYPSLKCLYMSGYADNGIARHGVLEPGTPFLAKPFTPRTLLQRVRQTLDKLNDE